MRNEHCMTWNMARNSEKLGKLEKLTVRPGICRETVRNWKMRNAHCKTWNMARELKNVENQTQTLTWNMVRDTEKRGK